MANGTVFVGSVPGERTREPHLLAIDAGSGEVRWRIAAPLPAMAAPAYDSVRVFFALGNGTFDRDADEPAGALVCIDAGRGRPQWEVRTSGSLYGSPACADENVFIVGGDGLCECLRQRDGQRVWQRPIGRRVVASPIVSGGAVYVVTVQGLLVKLDAATGREVWRFDDLEEYLADRDVFASPVLANGRIYLAAGGYVFCIRDRPE
jgi:outer membrane protein assembly factor BamB